MENLAQLRIQFLLSLIKPSLPSIKRIKLMDKIETISGFDLVFILSLITRYKFSGILSIVDEENELSSVTFIYGDIVKVDHPDQEHLLGNVIVDSDFIAKYEMDEIVTKAAGQRLGDYLIKNNHLTEAQLRKILFKQSKLRLTKYLNNKNIRIHFSFDGQSSETILISSVNYSEILYKWIFKEFKDEWLGPYADYYSANYLQPNIDVAAVENLKDFPEVQKLTKELRIIFKNRISYKELSDKVKMEKEVFNRVLHYMVLSGYLVVKKNPLAALVPPKKQATEVDKLEEDLVNTKILMLNKKYFEAFGILNKYSSLYGSHEKVNFYILWVKLIGIFYNNHAIDAGEIEKKLNEIDSFRIDPAEFYYVRSLLAAVQKKYQISDEHFLKAVSYNKIYKKYPINKDSSFSNLIKNFFGSLNIGD